MRNMKLFEEGKTAEIAKNYTENCIIVQPGEPTGKGRAAAKKLYDNLIKFGRHSITLEPLLGLEYAGSNHLIV